VTGDSWFASLNTLQKLKEREQYFMGMVKTAHSGILIQHLRGSFSQQSVRGDTITLHLGACHDRVFVHAWNEPGWRNGKAPKKQAKVFIANCFSAAPLRHGERKELICYRTAWWKDDTLTFLKLK
jgi:hypothetical protein